MDENNPNSNPNPVPMPAPEPTPEAPSAPEPATSTSNPTPTPAESLNQSVNDEAIIETYVGNNYQKISTSPFNVAAFFGNFFYLFYRKQYLFGFFAFIIYIIAVIAGAVVGSSSGDQQATTSAIVPSVVYTVISLVLGFGFNKSYIASARHKIAKLRETTPGITDDETKGTMKQKGGTSAGALIGSIVMFIITVIITMVVLLTTGAIKFFIDSASNPDNYAVSQDADGTVHISFSSNGRPQDDVYNGSMSLDSDNAWDDIIDVTFPDGFEQDEVLEDLYSYQVGTNYRQTCEAEFSLPIKFSGAEALIGAMADYEPTLDPAGETSDIDTYKSNGQTWHYYYSDSDDSDSRTYRLTTDIDDHIVLLSYDADVDYVDECEALLWELVDSVEAK